MKPTRHHFMFEVMSVLRQFEKEYRECIEELNVVETMDSEDWWDIFLQFLALDEDQHLKELFLEMALGKKAKK